MMKPSLALHKFTLYLPLFVLTTALGADVSCDAVSLLSPPPCLVENHHGVGNCPLQVLQRYTKVQLDTWMEENTKHQHLVASIAMHH
jgi:hypothetical protein